MILNIRRSLNSIDQLSPSKLCQFAVDEMEKESSSDTNSEGGTIKEKWVNAIDKNQIKNSNEYKRIV